jgi:hypothetical protein
LSVCKLKLSNNISNFNNSDRAIAIFVDLGKRPEALYAMLHSGSGNIYDQKQIMIEQNMFAQEKPQIPWLNLVSTRVRIYGRFRHYYCLLRPRLSVC